MLFSQCSLGLEHGAVRKNREGGEKLDLLFNLHKKHACIFMSIIGKTQNTLLQFERKYCIMGI